MCRLPLVQEFDGGIGRWQGVDAEELPFWMAPHRSNSRARDDDVSAQADSPWAHIIRDASERFRHAVGGHDDAGWSREGHPPARCPRRRRRPPSMSCCAGGRAVTRSRRRHLKQYGMLGWAMERAPVPSGRPRVGCDGERKGRRGGVRELTCRTEAYQPHLHGWFEGFRRS